MKHFEKNVYRESRCWKKVGALTLLPFVEKATTQMVADFYGVDVRGRVGEGSMLSKYTNDELELLYNIAIKFAREIFGY